MKRTPSEAPLSRGPLPFPSGLPVLLAMLVSGPGACARGNRVQVYAPTLRVLAELDDFGTLLLKAGLPPEELPVGQEVSVAEARRLRLTFQLAPLTPQVYGPRLVAETLLREVEEAGKPMSRSELAWSLQRYQTFRVLRPDGYLASALTGEPSECVGPVKVRDGALKAREFELGAFYIPDGEDGWTRVVEVPAHASIR